MNHTKNLANRRILHSNTLFLRHPFIFKGMKHIRKSCSYVHVIISYIAGWLCLYYTSTEKNSSMKGVVRDTEHWTTMGRVVRDMSEEKKTFLFPTA